MSRKGPAPRQGRSRIPGSPLPEADLVVAANVRTAHSFAVANAYGNWSDVKDEEVLDLLKNSGQAAT